MLKIEYSFPTDGREVHMLQPSNLKETKFLNEESSNQMRNFVPP